MNPNRTAYQIEDTFPRKNYTATGPAIGSPEQRRKGAKSRAHCACGFRVRGPNHTDGPHHRRGR